MSSLWPLYIMRCHPYNINYKGGHQVMTILQSQCKWKGKGGRGYQHKIDLIVQELIICK